MIYIVHKQAQYIIILDQYNKVYNMNIVHGMMCM